MAQAWVRAVAATFDRCVTAVPPDPPLDADVARTQHAAYVAALEGGGYEVTTIPADDDHPDCCFIEDTAVLIAGDALITNPGHPTRVGEVTAVAEALGAAMTVETMPPPATLDGGDVLQIGDLVVVGTGGRTNRDGFEALASFATRRGRRVMQVRIDGALHLKSAASPLDDETVLIHAATVPADLFGAMRTVTVPGDDPEAANVVRLADGSALVPEHHPATAETVAGLGFPVITVDVSEFARADGGVTCLSLRHRP